MYANLGSNQVFIGIKTQIQECLGIPSQNLLMPQFSDIFCSGAVWPQLSSHVAVAPEKGHAPVAFQKSACM